VHEEKNCVADQEKVMVAPFMFQNYAPNNAQKYFMSDENAQFLHGKLETMLTERMGIQVRVPLDNYFVNNMQEVVSNAIGSQNNTTGLALLNRTFILKMFEIQLASISQGKLTNKYYFAQDRPWTQPYGVYTGDQSVTVSPSNYMLSHPWKLQQESYLKAAMHIKPTTNLSTAPSDISPDALFYIPVQYCRIPLSGA